MKKYELDPKKRLTFMKATGLAMEFGFIVALPLVGFGLLGKWLDAKYDRHFFMLFGVLLALTSSIIWFYRRIKDLSQDLKNKNGLPPLNK